MEVIATLPADTPLDQVAERIRRIERLGFDTVHIPETVHDSLAVALLAAEHSRRLTIRTSMTVAFPRSPMVTAYAAWDLARFSGGRFHLGLAAQVRGNIEGRFSVAWTDPAGRLADYLRSLRAIFEAFRTGGPLDHRGEHYRFTRLQPYFNPGGADVEPPQLWTGGVNRRICAVAGELADGFVTHATNSHPRFLAERTMPAIAAGAARAGRTDGGPRVVIVSKCITALDELGLDRAREEARREFAFLYSTPAYRPTLDLLGHGEVGARLTDLARAGHWDSLPAVLTDEVLADLVPEATYTELPALLQRWYGEFAHGLVLNLPPEEPTDPRRAEQHDAEFAAMLDDIRATGSSAAVPGSSDSPTVPRPAIRVAAAEGRPGRGGPGAGQDSDVAALARRLQEVEDRLALMQLIATYGPAVDSGSPGPTADLWTENGVYDTYPRVLRGRQDIVDMVTGDLHQGLIGSGAAHLQGMPHIDIAGDRAVATSYSQLVLRSPDGDEYRTWRTGVNRWEFVRTPEGWRVNRRVNRQLDGSPEGRALLAAALEPDAVQP